MSKQQFATLGGWLESQEFYELCQTYRHSTGGSRTSPLPNAAEAFEALKDAIRKQASVPSETRQSVDVDGLLETLKGERDPDVLYACFETALRRIASTPSAIGKKSDA